MRSVAKAIRSHRESSKNRRAISRAIDNAASRSMRDELLILAQRSSDLAR